MLNMQPNTKNGLSGTCAGQTKEWKDFSFQEIQSLNAQSQVLPRMMV